MKMNKEVYEDLMLRFAKELHDVGVTSDMKEVIEDQYTRTPNTKGCMHEEPVRRFTYRANGYEITATATVKVILKTCS
ncbi:hypothetical protein OAA09_01245 [bacterium]|nr:hypothetical protein [bacterium]